MHPITVNTPDGEQLEVTVSESFRLWSASTSFGEFLITCSGYESAETAVDACQDYLSKAAVAIT